MLAFLLWLTRGVTTPGDGSTAKDKVGFSHNQSRVEPEHRVAEREHEKRVDAVPRITPNIWTTDLRFKRMATGAIFKWTPQHKAACCLHSLGRSKGA